MRNPENAIVRLSELWRMPQSKDRVGRVRVVDSVATPCDSVLKIDGSDQMIGRVRDESEEQGASRMGLDSKELGMRT
ncbi:hypothetical protein ACLOJK_037597 [Asimina triloba]